MNLLKQLLKPNSTKAKWLLLASSLIVIFLMETGHFSQVTEILSSKKMTLNVGNYSFSTYNIIKSIILIITLFWAVGIFADFGDKQIKRLMRGKKASSKTLVIKIFQGALYFISLLVALDIIGLDLTALAVFSGALGIGIGFGLQKIASNFISGLILIVEKSVEVGDLIELSDGTSGFLKKTAPRYTLVETFQGPEVLIPIEVFITSRVTNWTFSNEKARVDILIGVSYDSDLELVQKLILESASEHPKCSKIIEPSCFLSEFADSSVNFELFFWVDCVTEGRKGPRSEVLFSIWNKFKANNIEIPFPQRDIHIKSQNSLNG